MRIHDYSPPDTDVYGNISELNLAWLSATTELRGPQRARLADAPFLLFSLREHELDWWREVLSDAPQADWLQEADKAPEGLRRVQSAALAFLWQLSLRNPYAARLVSGASTAWCEAISAVPLVRLLDRVADRADLSRPRLASDATMFFDADCTSDEPRLRRSSHFVALQSLLTASSEPDQPLSAAACQMPRPSLRVADQLKE